MTTRPPRSARGLGAAALVAVGLILGSTSPVSGTPSRTLDSGSPEDAAEASPSQGAAYVPVTACRVMDTRDAGGVLTDRERRDIQVAGTGTTFADQGGKPGGCAIPPDAVAVETSITAVTPVREGFLRVWPAGETPPTATFSNFGSRRSTTNTGTLAVSSTGAISLQSYGGPTHYVTDVQGYFVESSPFVEPAVPTSAYVAVAPCRIADTRAHAGTPVAPGQERTFWVAGSARSFADQGGQSGGCAIPETATAVQASITAVTPARNGYLRAWPAGGNQPNATVLNFTRAESTTNTTALGLVPGEGLTLASRGGGAHYVIDVQGFYADTTTGAGGGGALYHPVTPCRVADTRGTEAPAPPQGDRRTHQITGDGNAFAAQGGTGDGCGLPTDASAVETSLSAVTPAGSGFLRTWPAGTPFPNSTVLNYSRAQNTTNTGPLTLSLGTDLTVATLGPTSHHVLDVHGYYRVPAIIRLPSDANTNFRPSISDDGRFVVFNGRPSDHRLPPRQVLLWDRESGSTRPIATGGSVDPEPEISGDGRYVAFTSDDPALAPGAIDPVANIFVWDRTTETVDQITDGDHRSLAPSIDADGSTIAFSSAATNLVSSDTNGNMDIFVWDRSTRSTTRITDGDTDTYDASLSADGNAVTFSSLASNLTDDPSVPGFNIFLWERQPATTMRVAAGVASAFARPKVDATGDRITFTTENQDVPAPTDQQVVVWDSATGALDRVEVGNSTTAHPVISGDGETIAFFASKNAGEDEHGVYLWHPDSDEVRRVSPFPGGETQDITADGRFVVSETFRETSGDQEAAVYLIDTERA